MSTTIASTTSTTVLPWTVTGSHRASTADSRPFGEWHARRLGDRSTACGQSAVGWPIFWDLDLHRGGDRACLDCTEVVRMAELVAEVDAPY
ncbi:hypothetical protein [Nocardioides sp. Soil796]|uniref:hypothetical protein n=1 Tax=Nocardioides sp. Soil796 TaxID=1736412 RepID=UPI00070C22F1|nr:hypothetical protein [Nocardioides sp. Soil796]KRF10374.1 hypothetical protein ASH02_19860 [Nocardioides sp. Soil796]